MKLTLEGVLHVKDQKHASHRGCRKTALGGYFLHSFRLFLGVAILWMLSSSSAYAVTTVPLKVNFQGRLTDSTGVVVADGLYNAKFALYDAASAGTLKWSETREVASRLQVTNGLFSVRLGDGTNTFGGTLDTIFAANSTLYFEITLANPATATCSTASCQTWESAMSRTQVATSAYAFNSDALDGYDSSYFAPATGSTAYAPMSGSTNYAPISGSTNYAPISGSANYIQNGTGAQTANFNVSGSGTIGGAGTVTGAFTNNGAAMFYNSTNSSAAFTIQRQNADDMFVADTTGSRVYIGNTTVDTSTVVLVLDSATADPGTAVNGSQYYNSTNNRFRCYEGGAWKNCATGVTSSVSTATQSLTAGTNTYLTGSAITLPSGGLTTGTLVTWRIYASKTNAGTAASTLQLRVGTNGTTSDTQRCSNFSTGTATAAYDGATITITAYATAGGSSATLNCSMTLTHQLASGGFANTNTPMVQVYNTATSFNSTTSGTKMGIAFNAGTSSVITVQKVEVSATNL